jgi:hypothetical protein
VTTAVAMAKSKSTAKYSLLPTEDDALLNDTSDDEDTPSAPSSFPAPSGAADEDESDSERTVVEGEPPAGHTHAFPPQADPRFVQTPPAVWKRAALLFLIFFAFWLAFQIKGHRATPKVVHSSRCVALSP